MAAKKTKAAKPEISVANVSNEEMYKRISVFVAKYNLSEPTATILEYLVREAYHRLDLYHDFDDLGSSRKQDKQILKSVSNTGLAFIKSVNGFKEIYGDYGYANQFKMLIENVEAVIARAKGISNRNSFRIELRGRKRREDWATIINPLALGYQIAFGKHPTISNNERTETKRGKFGTFFDNAVEVITGERQYLHASTLSEHLVRWRSAFKKETKLKTPYQIAQEITGYRV